MTISAKRRAQFQALRDVVDALTRDVAKAQEPRPPDPLGMGMAEAHGRLLGGAGFAATELTRLLDLIEGRK